MHVTNDHDLPRGLVEALTVNHYSKGHADISVTGLAESPRVQILRRAHWKDLTEDVSERLWRVFGTAVHTMLEKGDPSVLVDRQYVTVNGWVIGGLTDVVEAEAYGDGFRVIDYKVTKAYAARGGPKPEWIAQLNAYRYMLEQAGYLITGLQIVPLIRDYSTRDAERYEDYPPAEAFRMDVPMWPLEETLDYLAERVEVHRRAREAYAERGQDGLPECTDEERWATPQGWGLVHRDAVRPKAVAGTVEEVWDAAHEKGAVKKDGNLRAGYEIKWVFPTYVRCESYCAVRDFCQQYYRDVKAREAYEAQAAEAQAAQEAEARSAMESEARSAGVM